MKRISFILILTMCFCSAQGQLDSIEELDFEKILLKEHFYKLQQEYFEIDLTADLIDPEWERPLWDESEINKIEIIDITSENPTRLKSGPSQFDSRIELSQLDTLVDWEEKIIRNASSVGIIVEKELVDFVSENYYFLELPGNLEKRFGICPNEPFSRQKSIGVGTAFLIGKDTIITAAHVFERPLNEYYVVFGFHLAEKNFWPESIIYKDDIIQLDKLLPSYILDEYDIAVVKLKREAQYTPLKFSSKTLKTDTPVYAIGHPLGIPQKVSLNARIIENNIADYFFYTTLDGYQGNSGSPVFDFENNEVIGILVSGVVDMEERGGCLISKQCKPPYCRGEKIVKIDILNDH